MCDQTALFKTQLIPKFSWSGFLNYSQLIIIPTVQNLMNYVQDNYQTSSIYKFIILFSHNFGDINQLLIDFF